MDAMTLLGYIAAIFIGISLGLVGGGGSILTVPVLVYLFSVNPVLSTSYSLFVVGSTSLVGAVNNFREKMVSLKVALLFGFSSIVTVFLIRKWLVPAIPEHLFHIGKVDFTKSMITMLLFAVLMLMASIGMIRRKQDFHAEQQPGDQSLKIFLIILYGLAVGTATGLLGAGGGFLLIPALVLLIGLPMKRAVGTSLLIIALNSLIGFVGDIGHFQIDWGFLLTITAISIAGIFIGTMLGRRIQGEKLKKGFGWFILVTGLFIILHEIIN